MKARNLTMVGLLTFVLACVSPMLAQSDRGAITGRVTDPNGAVVPECEGDCHEQLKPTRLARSPQLMRETTPSRSCKQRSIHAKG